MFCLFILLRAEVILLLVRLKLYSDFLQDFSEYLHLPERKILINFEQEIANSDET